MIKHIQAINTVKTALKAIEQTTVTQGTKIADDISPELSHVNPELLQAYKGIVHKRLFQNFDDFFKAFKLKLQSFKDVVPENLYNKISDSAEKSDFNLTKIISEHYSGLNDCKTVAEAKSLYPEIKVFDLNFEDEITNNLKSITPASLFDDVQKCKTLEEKIKIINQFFDSKLANTVKKWGIYPEVKQLQDNIALEMITGKFKGTARPTEISDVFKYKEPLQYRFMREPNREETILNILRDNYINLNSYSGKVFKTADGREIVLDRLTHRYNRLSGLDSKFIQFIKKSEETAKEFAMLAATDKNIISSAVLTESWKTSGLRAELGNATAYKKDWSLIKQVWQKTMFPETTFYSTDKLIDAYLVNLYKIGQRKAASTNPFSRFQENPSLDKTKIMLLKRLYKFSKSLDEDKRILENPNFKEFKAQFDIDAMAQIIEKLEEHYKNTFFKIFWTSERIQKFKDAIHKNREVANKNIKISDSILIDAMNNILV